MLGRSMFVSCWLEIFSWIFTCGIHQSPSRQIVGILPMAIFGFDVVELFNLIEVPLDFHLDN